MPGPTESASGSAPMVRTTSFATTGTTLGAGSTTGRWVSDLPVPNVSATGSGRDSGFGFGLNSGFDEGSAGGSAGAAAGSEGAGGVSMTTPPGCGCACTWTGFATG